jgi:hypothetical protein
LAAGYSTVFSVTKPLALIFYENLLTGNQLLNRLSDLDYRTLAVTDVVKLPDTAGQERPLLIVCELGAMAERLCSVVRGLRATPATAHVPVVGYVREKKPKDAEHISAQAQAAGMNLVVNEAVLLSHLPQLLEQALRLD